MTSRRSLIIVVAVVVSIAAGSASAASQWTLRFSFVPQRAYQGQPAAVSALVKPTTARCALLVRYADNSVQQGLGMLHARSGRVEWKWTLAPDAPAGAARAVVTCGHSGTLSRAFIVVGGSVLHSKLTVVNTGFSQRPNRGGPGSAVSYGVVLDNPSNAEDAVNVSVQVNFLDATNHTLETTTSRVKTVRAASTFNLGGYQSLPSQTPVVKLEVVVQTGGYVKRSVHEPAVENVHVVPATTEPNWVGEVDGDLINDDPSSTLTNAQVYIVLSDSAGNIVGGGSGFLLSVLPPGTRSYFSASFGFQPVPTARATTVSISVVPTYQAPGA